MAKLMVYAGGYSEQDLVDALLTTTMTSKGASGFTLSYSGGSLASLTIRGKNLTYDASNRLTGGLITQIEYRGFEGTLLWTASSLAFDAASMQAAVLDLAAGDSLPFETLMQSPTWVATGGNISDGFYGGYFADSLNGGWGNDVLVGFAGNDKLVGGPLTGPLASGAENGDDYDTVDYLQEWTFNLMTGGPAGAITVDLRLASGQVTDTYGNQDTLRGIEWIIGTPNADTFHGSDTTIYEAFSGNYGADVIDGGGGLNDEVRYDRESGTHGVVVDLSAGTGVDTFGDTDTLLNIERVRGTAYADTLTGSNADNVLMGLAGNDILAGGVGYDTIRYDYDSSTASSSGSYGRQGIRVNLQVSVDAFGIIHGIARDGYGSVDTLTSIENVRGTAYNDRIVGSNGANTLYGLDGGDYLDGGAGVDKLYGGAGDDILLGGNSQDTLDGGDGADSLVGGIANDRLTGGSGFDTFVFDTALSATVNVDTITDFSAVDDLVQLSSKIFSSLAVGSLATSAFGTGAVATTATQRILWDGATGNLLYDADGNGAGAAIQFAHMDAVGGLIPTLTAANFVVV